VYLGVKSPLSWIFIFSVARITEWIVLYIRPCRLTLYITATPICRPANDAVSGSVAVNNIAAL